ncbi:MAG TPA: hypothetical protein VH391_06910 [Solirubrobacterales bacterium]|jgi:hypothetical protein
MSEPESQAPPPEGPGAPAEGQQQPQSEEELRARIEEQLRTVRVQDLLLESVVSVLNLTARRIAKEDERDLEQARVGIEAVRAVVGLLDREQAEQVRSALSQVQVLYAKHAGEGEPKAGEEEAGPERPPAPESQASSGGQRPPSRLWTPPGT